MGMVIGKGEHGHEASSSMCVVLYNILRSAYVPACDFFFSDLSPHADNFTCEVQVPAKRGFGSFVGRDPVIGMLITTLPLLAL